MMVGTPQMVSAMELFQNCERNVEAAARSAEKNNLEWVNGILQTLQEAKESLLTLGMPCESSQALLEQLGTGVLTGRIP